MATAQEKINMLRHTLKFYANSGNYMNQQSMGTPILRDSGQRAKEILELTDGPETEA